MIETRREYRFVCDACKEAQGGFHADLDFLKELSRRAGWTFEQQLTGVSLDRCPACSKKAAEVGHTGRPWQ